MKRELKCNATHCQANEILTEVMSGAQSPVQINQSHKVEDSSICKSSAKIRRIEIPLEFWNSHKKRLSRSNRESSALGIALFFRHQVLSQNP